MRGCFDNMCTCIYCVCVLFVLCFYIVSFMYIYSHLLLVLGLLPQSENSIAVNDDDDDDDNNNNNNNNNGKCMLIDVAISGDRNVIKKEAEKILKYKDLTIEIRRMWNVKTKVIPVIIGATGTISKSFRKYVSNIPGNHEVKEHYTAHILRKMLT